MKYIQKFLFLIGIILHITNARRIDFYRKDYTYFEKFNAFYKLHWNTKGTTWNDAFMACDGEEATLFYPKLEEEWTLVKNLTYALEEPPNATDIFVGIHDMYSFGEFSTVDGYSSSLSIKEPNDQPKDNCVTMNINTGKYKLAPCNKYPYTPLAFVCKKKDSEYCPTIDPGYQYIKSLKKCYKVNNRLKTWDEAVRICYMEGGALIVLQNPVEADIIGSMLKRGTNYHSGTRLLQFKYFTVRGQSVDDVYQLPYKQPYEQQSDQHYECGSLYKSDSTLFTKTDECNTELPFICEMEINK